MISRRQLLQATSLLLLPGCRDRDATAEDPASRAALLAELQPLAAIGEALSAAERAALQAATRPLLERLGNAGADQYVPMLHEAIRLDFLAGRICRVDGWMLSATECGLAALVEEAIAEGRLAAVSSDPAGQRYAEGRIVAVSNWGPRKTTVGTPFNVQRDGHSGLWIVAADAPSYLQVELGGIVTPANVRNDVITTGLYDPEHDALLDAPGHFEVALLDPVREIRQRVGDFTVLSQPGPDRSAEFCAIEGWGPQRTRAGVAANAQPNGAMGLWFRTDCVPEGARIYLGKDRLPMTRRPFGFTSSIPVVLLEARGRVPLSLVAPDGSRQTIGDLIIE